MSRGGGRRSVEPSPEISASRATEGARRMSCVRLGGSLDHGVDLYELIDKAENGHTEQGGRRDVVVELGADLPPCGDEVFMRADDVDRELMDVVAAEAVVLDQREEVGKTPRCLGGRVIEADDGAVTVDGNL